MLENSSVRVFRLALQPGEATLSHRHERFYVFVDLGGGDVSNEVKGRPPIANHLEDGELRTSKGGFTLIERNAGSATLAMVVIEPSGKTEAGAFEEPMGNFRYHDAALGALFEGAVARGYEMTIASEGRTEKHSDKYDRLLLALNDLQLKDEVEGKGASVIERKAGDVLWFPGGSTHAITNIGKSPAHFITIEFR